MSKPKPLKNLLGFLTKKAPKLAGTLVEEGLNLATGGAVGKIKDLILGDTHLSAEDKQLAILELQQDHQEYLAELQDRQDARALDLERMKSEDKFVRRFPLMFVMGVSSVLAILCFGLLFLEVPESSRPVIFTIIGALVVVVTGYKEFAFGSSTGSKEKSSQLTQFLTTLNK